MDHDPSGNLMQLARVADRSGAFITGDLAAALYPGSDIRFSDRMLTYVRLYIKQIVTEIETQICRVAVREFGDNGTVLAEIGNRTDSVTLPLLQKAGLLKDPELLEYFFARGQENELWSQLLRMQSAAEMDTGISRHLDSDSDAVADSAMALLAARARGGGAEGRVQARMEDLPAEILHSLSWRIAAALERLAGLHDGQLENCVGSFLSNHDEGRGRQSCAMRLAQALDGDAVNSEDIPHPASDGLDLFLARLAYRGGLPVDQIARMTAEPHMARLVVLLRSLDFLPEQAASVITLLTGGDLSLTGASYLEIDPRAALAMVGSWSKNPVYREARMRLFDFDTGHFEK